MRVIIFVISITTIFINVSLSTHLIKDCIMDISEIYAGEHWKPCCFCGKPAVSAINYQGEPHLSFKKIIYVCAPHEKIAPNNIPSDFRCEYSNVWPLYYRILIMIILSIFLVLLSIGLGFTVKEVSLKVIFLWGIIYPLSIVIIWFGLKIHLTPIQTPALLQGYPRMEMGGDLKRLSK